MFIIFLKKKSRNILLNQSSKYILLIFLLITPFTICFSDEDSFITPSFIKIITDPFEQYNDVNPSWSNDGKYISFERYDMSSHNIIITNRNGKKIQTIKTKGIETSELDFLFSETEDVTSYNTGISWSKNNNSFVFISSGKSNNFDLYLGKLNTEKTRRLTFHANKDNQAQWSPTNDEIVFISAREGNAGLYLINISNKTIKPLLDKSYDVLHPVWSPDGKKIALMVGENNTYSIYIMDIVNGKASSPKLISHLSPHNIRPSWSPDGKKISYFSFNEKNEWNINLVTLNGEKPNEETVAKNVIQNSSKGPTWLPDSNNIAYIKNKTNAYNPIYIVNISLKKHGVFLTNTKMNLDLSCSSDGTLAFQSQDRQWSRVYIAGIPGFKG